ncbi:AraC family transcriptional regulator [Photobacterium phosphoreum]|uniref:AraC family transcriptional regulator n=1 Tax=Photobacterium phosphoreum TaxID=659 RepID=UPI000D154C84|nr:AraC family transcriptional regulator [Photobacterium phosphoreum]PTB32833.1 AraC family transcriptional regulator [Photobacterium phosphoreum]
MSAVETLTFSVHAGWFELLNKVASSMNIDQINSYSNHLPINHHRKDLHQLRNLLHHLAKQLNDPVFAIKAAKYIHPLSFSSFSLVLFTAPTVQQLLLNAVEYAPLLGSPLRLTYHQTPTGDAELWLINNEPFNKASHVSHYGILFYMSVLTELIQQAVRTPLKSVEVKLIEWPIEPEYKVFMEQQLACVVSVDSAIQKICIRRSELSILLPAHEPDLYESQQILVRKQLVMLGKKDILLQIYKYLDQHQNLQGINGEKVANSLSVSFRTLNRRLAQQGSSFRLVLDKYKLEKSLILLDKNNKSISEVAYQMGFSDSSCFSRSFKKWTGYTPKTKF